MRGGKRIIISAGLGFTPLGLWGLTFFVDTVAVAHATILLAVGSVLATFAYTWPGWGD